MATPTGPSDGDQQGGGYAQSQDDGTGGADLGDESRGKGPAELDGEDSSQHEDRCWDALDATHGLTLVFGGMTTYLSFLALVLVITIAPGPDSALTLRAALVRGRGAGIVTMAGVSVAGAVQGLLAAGGLGAIIVASEPLFLTVKWVGAAYLLWLGGHALWTAWKGDFATEGEDAVPGVRARSARGKIFAQGFLCNLTNPKVLAFNLAVLPQFVGDGAGVSVLALYALSLVALGALWLTALVVLADRARVVLSAPRVRRRIEGAMGAAMIGFSAKVATTH